MATKFGTARNEAPDGFQIFTNGTIYNAGRKEENMVVKDGKVCALNVDLAKFKDAQIIDLGGGVAYPGFHDSHAHLPDMFDKDNPKVVSTWVGGRKVYQSK